MHKEVLSTCLLNVAIKSHSWASAKKGENLEDLRERRRLFLFKFFRKQVWNLHVHFIALCRILCTVDPTRRLQLLQLASYFRQIAPFPGPMWNLFPTNNCGLKAATSNMGISHWPQSTQQSLLTTRLQHSTLTLPPLCALVALSLSFTPVPALYMCALTIQQQYKVVRDEEEEQQDVMCVVTGQRQQVK